MRTPIKLGHGCADGTQSNIRSLSFHLHIIRPKFVALPKTKLRFCIQRGRIF